MRVAGIGNQYRIIDSNAGWLERASRGRIRVDGADRLSFLQALLTNDLDAVRPDRGVYAAYLTPQGRLIADLRLFDRGTFVLADVPAAVAASLVTRLNGLIFSEDTQVSDVTASLAVITVVGTRAPERLGRALGRDAGLLSAMPALGALDQPPFFVVRSDDVGAPMFDVILPADQRETTVAKLEAGGVEPISSDIVEALRIEAGRPAFGADMDEHTIPLEAGLLERAISLTKGCYVGQEVIVRVLHRGGGRVAKRLVKLAFDPALEDTPPSGTAIRVDHADAGRITSAARSVRLGRVVALGYVPRETADAGGSVTAVVGGREWTAEIAGLAG